MASKVLISNGFGQFHMTVAAQQLSAAGRLDAMLTAGYPQGAWRHLARALPKAGPIRRLLERDVPALPSSKVSSFWGSEFGYQLSQYLFGYQSLQGNLQPWTAGRALVAYQRAASRWLRTRGTEAKIYHFRAGFGGGSLRIARDAGMKIICDHSIVHPQLMSALIASGGKPTEVTPKHALGPFWQRIQEDIDASDVVVVNSEFVKKTFGWANHSGPVQVVNLGLDQRFSEMLNEPKSTGKGDALRFMFAGTLEARKGISVLAAALPNAMDVKDFLLVGNWDPAAPRESRRILDDPRVRSLGKLDRGEFARELSRTDVFVFPSLAEGSARVVMEAMAAGCAVITTPNSGSIVEHERTGLIVPVGEARALSDAMNRLANDQELVHHLGHAAAQEVRANYRRDDYVQRLTAVYSGA